MQGMLDDLFEAPKICGVEGQGDRVGLERGIHDISLPVHEDDVGSVICHALLHRKTEEQMRDQWARLSGSQGRRCCPLAEEPPFRKASDPPLRGEDYCCAQSLPASLRVGYGVPCPEDEEDFSFGMQLDSNPNFGAVPGISHVSAPLSTMNVERGAEGKSSTESLAGMPWQRLPGRTTREEWEEEWEQKGVRHFLTAPTSEKLERQVMLQFEDQVAKYDVIIHHAPQYHMLRHWLCGDDMNFIRSIHRCKPISTSGGKSGADFLVSHDHRFLLKAVHRKEFQMLEKKSDALFWHVDQVLFGKLPSVLVQVVGLFTVKVHSKAPSERRSKAQHWIVQRNLRWYLEADAITHFCFDLKGKADRKEKDDKKKDQNNDDANEKEAEDEDVGDNADATPVSAKGDGARVSQGGLVRAKTSPEFKGEDDRSPDKSPRATKAVNLMPPKSYAGPGTVVTPNDAAPIIQKEKPANVKKKVSSKVLLDQNFREWTQGRPLGLPRIDLMYLEAAIWNDCQLLAKQQLVDYSLLMAVAEPPDTGLDLERPETEALSGTLAIGIIDWLQPYNVFKWAETQYKTAIQAGDEKPTVIPPPEYAERFRQSMATVFVSAPAPPR